MKTTDFSMQNNLRDEAEKLKKQNRWQDIIHLLRPYTERREADTYIYSTLGFAYSQLQQTDKARYCYKQWLEGAKQAAVPLYCLGYLEYAQANWQAAVEWFDRALEERPAYLTCLYRKGMALMRLNKHRAAGEILGEMLREYTALTDEFEIKRNAKNYFKACFNRAKCHIQEKEYREALALLTSLTREGTRSYVKPLFLSYNKAKALAGLGRYQEALEELEPLEATDFVLDVRARCYLALDRPARAEAELNRALKKRPAAYLFRHRAEMWLARKNYPRAERDFREALKRDRMGKHKVLCALGRLRLEAGDPETAMAFFKKANAFKVKLYGKEDYHALLGLGDCLDLLNRKKEAYSAYSRAAAIGASHHRERKAL